MGQTFSPGPWPFEHAEREDGEVSPDRDFDTDEERDRLINDDWDGVRNS